MNLVKRNLEIVQVTSGNTIRNQQRGEYLRYDLKDPMNTHIGYPAQTSFNKGVIADFKAVLPKSKGGDLPDDPAWTEEMIPMKLRLFPGAVDVTYDLHGEYCMLYSEDILDEAGNIVPGKAKGDVVCGQNGLPKVYTTVPIVCAQGYEMEQIWNDQKMDWEYQEDGVTPKERPVKDANGNLKRIWLRGYSPEEVGEGRKAMMVPYTEALKRKFNVQDNSGSSEEITESEAALFQGPAANPTPTAQPVAQPAAAQPAAAPATA